MTRTSPEDQLQWEAQPLGELRRLSWPMVISLLSFSLMTLVDTLFIGWLGFVELAAAGLGGTGVFTVASFGLAVFSAAKVEVGENHGLGNHAEVDRALGSFLRLALIMGVGSLIAGEAIALLLPLATAHKETGELAQVYVALRSLGLPFVLFSSAIGQWLSAQGDSKTAMRAALVANIVNVPLNAFLIFGLDLGLVGAALASAGSRLVEAWWLYRRQRGGARGGVFRGTSLGLQWAASTWKMSMGALQRGLPTGVERVLDMVAFAAVPLLLSQVGPAHVAAHQIVLQVLLLSFLPGMAFSDALSVLVAQAVGADRHRLVRRVSVIGMRVALVYAALCGALLLTFSRGLVSLFTPEVEVIEIADNTLIFAAILQFINTPYTLVKGILRGLSVFRFVAWVTVVCAWTITPPLTYLLGVRGAMGTEGAWLTLCLEVTVGFGLLLLRLRTHSVFAVVRGAV